MNNINIIGKILNLKKYKILTCNIEKDNILEYGESKHHRLQQFAMTLNNWYEGILGYCKHSTDDFKFTNAFTEGYNNHCKTIKRQGYGFRIKDNYFKKIWIRELSKKSNLFSSFGVNFPQ